MLLWTAPFAFSSQHTFNCASRDRNFQAVFLSWCALMRSYSKEMSDNSVRVCSAHRRSPCLAPDRTLRRLALAWSSALSLSQQIFPRARFTL